MTAVLGALQAPDATAGWFPYERRYACQLRLYSTERLVFRDRLWPEISLLPSPLRATRGDASRLSTAKRRGAALPLVGLICLR